VEKNSWEWENWGLAMSNENKNTSTTEALPLMRSLTEVVRTTGIDDINNDS